MTLLIVKIEGNMMTFSLLGQTRNIERSCDKIVDIDFILFRIKRKNRCSDANRPTISQTKARISNLSGELGDTRTSAIHKPTNQQ